MITGRQLREARRLLRLSPSTVAKRAHMHVKTIERAEVAGDDDVPLTKEQAERLRSVFERLGVEFVREADGEAGVRRRAAPEP